MPGVHRLPRYATLPASELEAQRRMELDNRFGKVFL
jgi:hypothetical protein